MKTLPVAVGLASSLFFAGLLLKTLVTINRKILPLGRITTAVAKAGGGDATLALPRQFKVDATSYLSTAKRLLVFARILPRHERIVVFYSSSGDGSAVVHAREAAKRLGVGLLERPVRTVGELEAALSRIKSERVDGIFHIPDPLISAHVNLVLEQAKECKIPTMTYDDSYVAHGALMAYAMGLRRGFPQDQPGDMARSNRTEERVRGKRTSRYQLVLNLQTADQIDFMFPQIALDRADRIIAHEAD